jgi:hypothetical protein
MVGKGGVMKIGSRVKIKNLGEIYSTYWTKFKEMGFKNPETAKNINYEIFDKSIEFKVFAKSDHECDNIMLYGIEDKNGNQFLIGESGLKLIRKRK